MTAWWLMTERTIAALAVLLMLQAPLPRAEERAWQTGTWVDVQFVRPRVVFGIVTGNPGTVGPRQAEAVEDHLYVIETDAVRLEMKQKATADRRINVRVGEPATFALEKKTIYVKDVSGKEYTLSVTKKTEKTK